MKGEETDGWMMDVPMDGEMDGLGIEATVVQNQKTKRARE